MIKEHNRTLRKIQLLLDLVITAGSFATAFLYFAWQTSIEPSYAEFSRNIILLYLAIPLWTFLLRYYGAYRSIRTQQFSLVVFPVIKTAFAGGVLLMTFCYAFRIEASRELLYYFLIVNAFFLAAARVCVFSFFRYIRRKGLNYRTVVIVGTGQRARAFADLMDNHAEWAIKVLGFIDGALAPSEASPDKHRILGTLNELRAILTNMPVDEVVFILPRKWIARVEDAVMECHEIGIKTKIAADIYPQLDKAYYEEFMDWPMMTFNPTYRLDEALVLKRAVDLVLSTTALIVLSPVFAAVAVAVKLTSPGPVFFKQERCGRNGRRFYICKFRTMVNGAESMRDGLVHRNEMSGPVFKIKNDPRVTPLGRFLRKYSLDEIPQFINVLKGDMSIVGPRPPLPTEVKKYDFWQRRRLSVQPGIICLWQVNGRNGIDFNGWVELDMEDIDNWSMMLDMKIMLKTIPAILKGSGM